MVRPPGSVSVAAVSDEKEMEIAPSLPASPGRPPYAHEMHCPLRYLSSVAVKLWPALVSAAAARYHSESPLFL